MTSTLPPLIQAFSGAIGSAAANALTYPLALATTRLQLESPRRSKVCGGIYGAGVILRHTVRKYGWGALYDGLWPDTCASILSNFFYFYFYSFLRSLSTRRRVSIHPFSATRLKAPNSNAHAKPHKPTLVEELVLGFIAGIASRAISTPLNIITLRLQTERGDSESEDSDTDSDTEAGAGTEAEYLGLIDVVKLIYNEQGLAGFWRGFQTSMLLSINPSITLAFFQMFRHILTLTKSPGQLGAPHSSKRASPPNLHPREAFLGGAMSNSMAVAILYPLILGKMRLQASPSTTTMREVLVDAYEGKDVLASKHHPSHPCLLDGKEVDEAADKGAGGITGLYQGLEPKLVKGFLSQGVTLLVKGRIEQVIVAAYLRQRRTAH